MNLATREAHYSMYDDDNSSAGSTPSSLAMAQRFQALLVPPADPDRPVLSLPVDDRYVFGEVFASGGLGQIRRAFDRVLGRTIAVKETLGPASAARFLREAQVTARLEHPAIVPIHDIGVHPDGQPYYCMKLIDGRSLETAISETTSVSGRLMLLANLVTVIDAIAFAHSKGVLHRDLKPANILIGTFGETWVIDWGLAGLIDEDEDRQDPSERRERDVQGEHRARLTQTGEWVGTLPYMAPEQLRNGGGDQRADVYALGAVLYQILCGVRPYADIAGTSLLAHVLAHPPVDIERLAPGTSPELLAIVHKAMARAPASRYASAVALADELRRFQAGNLVQAHNYRVTDVLRRWVRRRRAILAPTLGALGLLLGMGIYSARRVASERDAAVENATMATEQRRAADSAYHEAQRRTEEARGALSDVLEETARQKLIEEYRPLDALAPLYQAAALTPGRSRLGYMIGEAERAWDALLCQGFGPQADELVLNPRHATMAFASRGRGVEIWSTTDCTLVERMAQGDTPYGVESLAFSGDGEHLLVFSKFWKSLLRYERGDTEAPMETHLRPGAGQGAFSRSGEFLLLRRGPAPGSSATVVSLHGSEAPQQIELAAAVVQTAPTGKRWASLADGAVTLHDDDTVMATLVPAARALLAVASTGDVLVDVDGRPAIYRRGGESLVLAPCGPARGEDDTYQAGVFDTSMPFVAALDGGGDLTVWRTDSGQCVGSVADRHVVRSEFVELDGRPHLLTLDGDTGVSVWDMSAGLTLAVALDAEESGVFDFAVQSATAQLVTLGRDGAFKVWDLSTLVGPPRTLSGSILAVHPSGSPVAIADGEGVRLMDSLGRGPVRSVSEIVDLDDLRWDSAGTLLGRSGTRVFVWNGPDMLLSGNVDVAEVFAATNLEVDIVDGTSLIVVSGTLKDRLGGGSELQDIRTYDLADGSSSEYPVGPRRHYSANSTVAGRGDRVLLGDTGIVLDTRTSAIRAELSSSAVFTPDGAYLLDLAAGRGLVLRDAETGALEMELDHESTLPSRTRGRRDVLGVTKPSGIQSPRQAPIASFSPSGRSFAVLGAARVVDLWSYPAFTHHQALVGHRLPVTRILWSPDESRMLTLGLDTRAYLWDVASGTQLAALEILSTDAPAMFSPSGALVVLQANEHRLDVIDARHGERVFARQVNALISATIDVREQRVMVVEGRLGQEMTLRALEIRKADLMVPSDDVTGQGE